MTTTGADTKGPREPLARPLAAPFAIIVSGLLIAISVVAGREFFIERDVVDEAPWIRNSFEWLSRITWEGWMLPASIAAVVVGIGLLFVAAKPRARTHFRTAGPLPMWLRPTDVARLSTSAATHVDGVRRAQTTVGRRTAKVEIVTDGRDPATITGAVQTAVTKSFTELAEAPKVLVAIDNSQRR
ncbi:MULTISPECIES: DUF6286 domain-containing protein [Antrihabitans]|jgi:hypothetical protein|uniref:DUF6286 domain-containing protein n=2 Tax=Antrihabitans TaxID=2799491 RepID=A0A934NQD6_9NOCA|nr:DUF6286 domain-containing protein [Antrihabitans stalagmiti]MBJ8339493.1 hypothetical protein [Antrihabitans stalagmiti]